MDAKTLAAIVLVMVFTATNRELDVVDDRPAGEIIVTATCGGYSQSQFIAWHYAR